MTGVQWVPGALRGAFGRSTSRTYAHDFAPGCCAPRSVGPGRGRLKSARIVVAGQPFSDRPESAWPGAFGAVVRLRTTPSRGTPHFFWGRSRTPFAASAICRGPSCPSRRRVRFSPS